MRLTLACGRYDRTRRRMKVDELFAPNMAPALAEYLRATGEA